VVELISIEGIRVQGLIWLACSVDLELAGMLQEKGGADLLPLRAGRGVHVIST
jgi:hypothetical protein